MNLLFVTPYFPPLTYGGIESQVYTLARSMRATHRCAIAAPGPDSDPDPSERGVPVYRTRALSPASGHAADSAQLVAFYERVCEREKVDRILAHNLHSWVPPQVAEALHLVAATRAIPVALRVHNFCGPAGLRRVQDLPWSNILCVSAEAADDLVRAGVAGRNVTVLYPPVDVARFRPAPHVSLRRKLGIAPERVVILHASRIVGGNNTLADKGVFSVMRAVARVKQADLVLSFPPAPSWLRGAHEQALTAIRRLASGLSIERRVHLISTCHDEMPGIYNGAQVFTMLSELEALGTVYLEAAACGLPVVGKDVGGVREGIVDAVSGFIVENTDQASTMLERLVRDSALRQRLGRAGGNRVRRAFSAPHIAAQLERALGAGADGRR